MLADEKRGRKCLARHDVRHVYYPLRWFRRNPQVGTITLAHSVLIISPRYFTLVIHKTSTTSSSFQDLNTLKIE
ncbi:hypothetical protein BV22DRAFT_542458 [Leucogyrophana mollusca]|uniref:Uncharacterized protein n=1 Tax=Leucogyrophana mollusca TaxID=85980 RepID=A0ACB8BFM3_9AGAM|nr:hypothetical protein BV22DRAFT_542458 [Leucogyrophana mollusca]